MGRFCVFCGKPPQEKNKEHVIPKWLIEMTGDPSRLATFGVDFHKEPFGLRKFAFDSLAFPACAACNERFSKLEGAVKPIFARLLAIQPLGTNDLILLLDWLDKVRVGLWLGYIYLDKNPMGINPSFHIESRIGRLDRMLKILRIEDARISLSFTGPEFKAYQLSPTCFGLRVNGLCLISASGVSLCSQRLGFPFMRPVLMNENHTLEVLPNIGSERIMNPVERAAPLRKSVSIYQPIFRPFLDLKDGEKYLESDWVRDRAFDMQMGYGKLFVEKRGSVQIYSGVPSSDWVPTDSWLKQEFKSLPGYVHERVTKDFENAIPLASKEQRKQMRRSATMAKMVDHAMLLRANEELGRVQSGTHVRSYSPTQTKVNI